MNTILENEKLKLEISEFGAELQEIKLKENGRNYLWNGDSAFWGRRSPVLFPFVGALKNKEYRYNGETFSMGQHGFARDMEFELIENNEKSAWYELKSNEETRKKYPFEFSLKIGYELLENTIKVKWKVENQDKKTMYFSIGAHPAFVVPVDKREECFLKFDNPNDLTNTRLENGLANEKNLKNGKIVTQNGNLKIQKDLFQYDALILENSQVREISLCTPDKKEFITVKFDSPLLGIWSPYKEKCPFVCIEPWYGRCDGVEFDGELQDRKWQQSLAEGEIFQCEYEIIVN